MPTFIDHYAVLGVKPTASPAAIRSTYRRLALAHHPDRVQDKELATATFAGMTVAYGILGDATSRRDYDARYKCEQDAMRRGDQHTRKTEKSRSGRAPAWRPEPDVDGSFDTGFGEHDGGGAAGFMDDDGDESRERTDYAREPADEDEEESEEEQEKPSADFSHPGTAEQEEAYHRHRAANQLALADDFDHDDLRHADELDATSDAAHLPVVPSHYPDDDDAPLLDGDDDEADDADDAYHDPDRWAALGTHPHPAPRLLGDGVADVLAALAADALSHREEQTVRGHTHRGAARATRRLRDGSCAALGARLDALHARALRAGLEGEVRAGLGRRVAGARGAVERVRRGAGARLRVLRGVAPARWRRGEGEGAAAAVVRGLEADAARVRAMEALADEAEGDVAGLQGCAGGGGGEGEARLWVRYLMFDLDEWARVGGGSV